MKKILVVDDSALMRRLFDDIISNDSRFVVSDFAKDGEEALSYVVAKDYDAIVLDINMPVMNGIDFLKELRRRNIKQRVLVASSDTAEGAKVTIEALENGAIEVVQKPGNTKFYRQVDFKNNFLDTLEAVCNVNLSSVSFSPFSQSKEPDINLTNEYIARLQSLSSIKVKTSGSKLIALASSTGGPKALQRVIPMLPANLDAPMLVVQHMPAGFTKSLAERLNSLSKVTVTEAIEGETLEKGHVYIAKGGAHLNIDTKKNCIHYTDEPHREGVKPCANYMYESLINSSYENIVCVVLTGMGADGTVGIKALSKASKGKNIHVIAQNEASCTVYGMPKNIVATGLVNSIVDLDNVAQEIITNVGVR